ncbi:MAG: hypothetical protein HYZ53_30035 [Planctomycetes bacterium]|nr:hypothetical protein [Planctomycetota bacterium]
MKRTTWVTPFLFLAAVATQLHADDDPYAERRAKVREGLKVLAPFVGTWLGQRKTAGEPQTSTRSFEWALGGTFLRGTTVARMAGEVVFQAELWYTWDPERKALVCYFLEDPGIVQTFDQATEKDADPATSLWEERTASGRPGMRIAMELPRKTEFRVVATQRDAQGRSQPFSDTTYRLAYKSSMGLQAAHWQVDQIPESFRGDWLLDAPPRPRAGGEPTAGQGAAVGLDYEGLVFRLTASPRDCRVLRRASNKDAAAPEAPKELGAAIMLRMDGGALEATFVGDFHLTYTLRLTPGKDGGVDGHFIHAGSGAVYYDGPVKLGRQ